MGDEIERELLESFYETDNEDFNSPARQAERRQAAAEAGEGALGSVSPFVRGVAVRSNMNFNPVMDTSFEAAIATLAMDQKGEPEVKAAAPNERSAQPARVSSASAGRRSGGRRSVPAASEVGAPPLPSI